jgi:hypothetical protein
MHEPEMHEPEIELSTFGAAVYYGRHRTIQATLKFKGKVKIGFFKL